MMNQHYDNATHWAGDSGATNGDDHEPYMREAAVQAQLALVHEQRLANQIAYLSVLLEDLAWSPNKDRHIRDIAVLHVEIRKALDLDATYSRIAQGTNS